MSIDHDHGSGFFRSKWNVLWIGFSLVAAFFLITEHAAHVFGVLPYLLILACPLMHLFMHGGHGHGGRGASHEESEPSAGERKQ